MRWQVGDPCELRCLLHVTVRATQWRYQYSPCRSRSQRVGSGRVASCPAHSPVTRSGGFPGQSRLHHVQNRGRFTEAWVHLVGIRYKDGYVASGLREWRRCLWTRWLLIFVVRLRLMMKIINQNDTEKRMIRHEQR